MKKDIRTNLSANWIFGGENTRNEIFRQLQARKIVFQYFIHQEISHYRVAEEIRVDISEGIKCLIMRGKKSQKNYLICIRGHQKVDMHAVAVLLEENCEFEKIDLIKERYGLEIGGIPPFGHLFGIDMYFDTTIQDCTEVIFSCGLANESLRMKFADLSSFIHPKFAKLARA